MRQGVRRRVHACRMGSCLRTTGCMVLSPLGYTRLSITDTGDMVKWPRLDFRHGSLTLRPRPIFSSPAAFPLLFTFIPLLGAFPSGESKSKECISSTETACKENAFRILNSNKRNSVSVLLLFVSSFQRRRQITGESPLESPHHTQLTTYQSRNVSSQRLRHTSNDVLVSPRSPRASPCPPGSSPSAAGLSDCSPRDSRDGRCCYYRRTTKGWV